MEQITVVVLGGAQEPALKRLNELGPGVKLKLADKASDLGPDLAEARVLFQWAGNREELKRVMAAAPRLEWIHGRYAGLDAILLGVTGAFGGRVADAFSAFQQASVLGGGLPCALNVGLALPNPGSPGSPLTCNPHPTVAGQQLIAQLVLNALKATVEFPRVHDGGEPKENEAECRQQ